MNINIPINNTCPNCGYCPHCRRSYPVYPTYIPYMPSYPSGWTPYTGPTYVCGGTVGTWTAQ